MDKKSGRIFHSVILCLLLTWTMPLCVQAAAKGEDTLPPHLIQSVTQQELYEGMVALGMLQCPVLKKKRSRMLKNVSCGSIWGMLMEAASYGR